MEVNLRSVECAVALVYDIVQTHFIQSASQTVCSHLPIFITSHAVFRTGRKLNMIFEAEQLVNAVDQLCNPFDLIFDLLRSHEDVRIILSEAAHTHQTMQLTGFLMTMNDTKLAHAQRQVAVGTRLGSINQNAARAVHRFDCVVLLVNDGGVHVVFVVIPVAGGLPQASV